MPIGKEVKYMKKTPVQVSPNMKKVRDIIDKDGNKLNKIKGDIIEKKQEPPKPSDIPETSPETSPKGSISQKIEDKINNKINEVIDKKIDEILSKML
jgi:hypothetical protein